MKRTRSAPLLLGVLLCVATNAFAQTAPPPDLDAYVEQVRQQFEVPGIALAVVMDGKVVVAKGYGVRRLGKKAPVDDRTLFAIASNTKAFTATALALLVEEGKIEWDAPVVSDLPWFQLSDPYVTREITVRDLLVHRSGLGLGAGDLLWWPGSDYDRKEVVRRLRYLPLASSFRSTYAYDNVLYVVAGELIETVSGQRWEDFVANRILAKVGMRDSNTWDSKSGTGRNSASPHARINGAVAPIATIPSDATDPAGGINASARDMAKWLLILLDSGRLPDGGRLFSEQSARQLWTPVTPVPIDDDPTCGLAPLKPQFNGYALGFGVRDYRGHKLIIHGGALPGYLSQVAMIPDLKLGVAVMTNQEAGAARGAILYPILDHYLGVSDTDWLPLLKECVERMQAKITASEKDTAAKRNSASRPPLPLEAYVGTYRDRWYGDVAIEKKKDGGLLMRFTHTPLLTGDMEHWQYDTFIVRWRAFRDRSSPVLRADAFVTFDLNPDGSIEAARMQPVSPATDFSFDFQDLHLKRAKPEKAAQ